MFDLPETRKFIAPIWLYQLPGGGGNVLLQGIMPIGSPWYYADLFDERYDDVLVRVYQEPVVPAASKHSRANLRRQWYRLLATELSAQQRARFIEENKEAVLSAEQLGRRSVTYKAMREAEEALDVENSIDSLAWVRDRDDYFCLEEPVAALDEALENESSVGISTLLAGGTLAHAAKKSAHHLIKREYNAFKMDCAIRNIMLYTPLRGREEPFAEQIREILYTRRHEHVAVYVNQEFLPLAHRSIEESGRRIRGMRQDDWLRARCPVVAYENGITRFDC